MEHHWEAQLERVDYCDVLRAMHLRYEQNQVGGVRWGVWWGVRGRCGRRPC